MLRVTEPSGADLAAAAEPHLTAPSRAARRFLRAAAGALLALALFAPMARAQQAPAQRGARGGGEPAQDEKPANPGAAAEPRDEAQAPGLDKVLIVPLEGPIDRNTATRLKSEVRAWLEREPAIRFLIFALDTPGGSVDDSKDIAHFIDRECAGRRRIAWIPSGKQALSGGTVVAFSCDEIVMGHNTAIGDVAPVLPWTMKELGEKAQTVVRELLVSFADRRGYSTILTRAMVSKDHDDIVRVELLGRGGERESLFLYKSEVDDLPVDQRDRVLRQEIVLRRDELLTLSEERAKDYGFIRHVADTREDVLLALGIAVGPENVIDTKSGRMKSPVGSGPQAVIDFFNRPFVRLILIAGGFLGLLLELKMLGTLIPGTVGLAFFAIFFLASLFPVTGSPEPTATFFEILLFLLGIGMVAVEFFLVQGVAIFALGGLALCLVSLILAMIPGSGVKGTQHMTFFEAAQILIYGFGTCGVVFLLLLKHLPKSRFGSGGLVNRTAIVGVPDADSTLESQAKLAALIGQTAVVETPLRPSGKVALEDGRVLDVVAEGQIIGKGEKVVIASATATRIVVRPTGHGTEATG